MKKCFDTVQDNEIFENKKRTKKSPPKRNDSCKESTFFGLNKEPLDSDESKVMLEPVREKKLD